MLNYEVVELFRGKKVDPQADTITILKAVIEKPNGFTSREIARETGTDWYFVVDVLNDLADNDQIVRVGMEEDGFVYMVKSSMVLVTR